MHSTLPRAARNQLEKIRNIDNERVGLGMDRNPDTVRVQHFESRVRRFGLAYEREPAKVCVGTDSYVTLTLLGWVVDGADVGHGVCGYGVEVVFGEVESKSEDVEHAFAEFEHGLVVAVDGWAPEEGGGVAGPLVARGLW